MNKSQLSLLNSTVFESVYWTSLSNSASQLDQLQHCYVADSPDSHYSYNVHLRVSILTQYCRVNSKVQYNLNSRVFA